MMISCHVLHVCWALWINFCGSDAYHKIHEILYTTKISMCMVATKIMAYIYLLVWLRGPPLSKSQYKIVQSLDLEKIVRL